MQRLRFIAGVLFVICPYCIYLIGSSIPDKVFYTLPLAAEIGLIFISAILATIMAVSFLLGFIFSYDD